MDGVNAGPLEVVKSEHDRPHAAGQGRQGEQTATTTP